jgi:integrase
MPSPKKRPTKFETEAREKFVEPNVTSESLVSMGGMKHKATTVKDAVDYAKRTRSMSESNTFYVERWANRMGNMKLRLVTPAVLRSYVDRGQSSGSQRRELGALVSCVNHFVRENAPDDAATISMKRPPENPGRDRIVEEWEEQAMEVAFPEELWAVARFCLRTGARPFEARRLVAADVMASRQLVRLTHTKGTGKLLTRQVPVMDGAVMTDLLERLVQCRDLDSRVFLTDKGEPWTRFSLKAAWDKGLALAGVTGLDWTDLRHTFATRLGRGGVTAPVIADILGHTDLSLVMRYVHVSSLDKEAAVRHASMP